MRYLNLPFNETRILPFYLAMEEYAAQILGDDDLFFMWQPDPTVIFGRNQLIDNEVNLDYCREHGIAYYRRKSGGGCVYADRDNIMLSYITRGDSVELTFSRYTSAVAAMLRALGLNATVGGRNDVLVDGMKVSGNAFYHQPDGKCIVHGTMLYDTDFEHISRAITPSKGKLESKGVQSVRSRVTTLSRHLDIGIEEFKAHVRATMCDGELTLNADDVRQIEEIMQSYLTPEFILGKNPRCTTTKRGRIEGCGEFEVSLTLNRNVITEVNIAGDYFLTGDLDNGIIKRLTGTKFTRQDVERALAGIKTGDIIMNLTNQQLINLLFS